MSDNYIHISCFFNVWKELTYYLFTLIIYYRSTGMKLCTYITINPYIKIYCSLDRIWKRGTIEISRVIDSLIYRRTEIEL